MINNSSLKKWDRLKQKNLDVKFVNLVKDGLNCSTFEANAILETVREVYDMFFETTGKLKLGQILFNVVSAEEPPGKSLSDCNIKTVTLTLDDSKKDIDIRAKKGVIGLRRHKIQRVCNEAFQQGGLLTVEDIANRLINCGERTIARDIKYFKDNGIVLPLRSTIKDIGRTLSHRSLIVKEWLSGYEYSQIARKTNHSLGAVQNYVDKFKKVICLINDNYDTQTISFLVKLSTSLTEEYKNIYNQFDIVLHRQEELDELLKKI